GCHPCHPRPRPLRRHRSAPPAAGAAGAAGAGLAPPSPDHRRGRPQAFQERARHELEVAARAGRHARRHPQDGGSRLTPPDAGPAAPQSGGFRPGSLRTLRSNSFLMASNCTFAAALLAVRSLMVRICASIFALLSGGIALAVLISSTRLRSSTI